MKIKPQTLFTALVLGFIASVHAAVITTGDYCSFLNDAAPFDPYDFYEARCSTIVRSGKPGYYGYVIAEEKTNDPINYLSSIDAARYCAWKENDSDSFKEDSASTLDFSCCKADDSRFAACDPYLKSNLLNSWDALGTEAPGANQENLITTSIVEAGIAVVGEIIDAEKIRFQQDIGQLRTAVLEEEGARNAGITPVVKMGAGVGWLVV